MAEASATSRPSTTSRQRMAGKKASNSRSTGVQGDKQERDTTPIGWQRQATEEEGTLDRPPSPVAISGFYLFTLELLTIALVFSKALHHNAGKKYVRVVQPGCHVAWADMNGDHSTVACCSLPSSSTTFLSFLLGGDDPPSEGMGPSGGRRYLLVLGAPTRPQVQRALRFRRPRRALHLPVPGYPNVRDGGDPAGGPEPPPPRHLPDLGLPDLPPLPRRLL